jgi:DNA-directed RNA polymerase specialized sigma24 family protein
MAEANSSPPAAPANLDLDEPPLIEPLTRGSCKRLPATERQIADAVALAPAMLIERAQGREESSPDFLSAEALVFFIRRAVRTGDIKTRDALFRQLFERCMPYFRGQFRGFARETREDLQGDVMKKVVEDLFAADDHGDFMQVRFWKYLDNKRIDACRTAFRHSDDMESLDTGFSGESESEGRTRLEKAADDRLSPEQLAILSEGLAKLPARLRHVFLLRHYVGMQVGSDDPADDAGDKLTIARQFGCSGRTIRNWLKEADKLLAGFREKNDGE